MSAIDRKHCMSWNLWVSWRCWWFCWCLILTSLWSVLFECNSQQMLLPYTYNFITVYPSPATLVHFQSFILYLHKWFNKKAITLQSACAFISDQAEPIIIGVLCPPPLYSIKAGSINTDAKWSVIILMDHFSSHFLRIDQFWPIYIGLLLFRRSWNEFGIW